MRRAQTQKRLIIKATISKSKFNLDNINKSKTKKQTTPIQLDKDTEQQCRKEEKETILIRSRNHSPAGEESWH